MSAKLIVVIEKDYPSDMDLTGYEGCDTVLEAAKLDKQLFDENILGLDELVESENVRVDVRVLGEV